MNYNEKQSPIDDEGVTLKEVIISITILLKLLRSKLMLIICFVLIGAVLGFIYAITQKPVYEATLTFALQDDQIQAGAGVYSGLVSQLGMDISTSGSGPFAGSNILELMKSSSVIEKTLLSSVKYNGKPTTLAEIYIKINKLREKWKEDPKLKYIQFSPGMDPDRFTVAQDSIIKGFYQTIVKTMLTVEKVEDATSIISVTIKSENELFAKIFAQTLVKDVSDFYVETKTLKTTENILILQHQTDSVQKELSAAIRGVASNSDNNPSPNPDMQVLHVESQRKAFFVQVNQTMLAELIRNLETAKVTLRKETPLIQIIDKPKLPLDVKRFSKFKGIVIGGFISGFLFITIIVICQYLRKVMSS